MLNPAEANPAEARPAGARCRRSPDPGAVWPRTYRPGFDPAHNRDLIQWERRCIQPSQPSQPSGQPDIRPIGGSMIVQFNVRDFLDRAEFAYPDRVGLIDEPNQPAEGWGQLTFSELAMRARAQAAGPQRLDHSSRRLPGRAGGKAAPLGGAQKGVQDAHWRRSVHRNDR